MIIMGWPCELDRLLCFANTPPETTSLLDRLWRCPDGLAGTGLSRSMPSSDGVNPVYHAVGDEGETRPTCISRSSFHIELG